jgi:AbrB family looped-hinge helix DNA binding protein
MAKTAVVSSKAQATLPKKLRARRQLTDGSRLLILETKDEGLVRPARHSLRGLLRNRINVELAEREIRALRGVRKL